MTLKIFSFRALVHRRISNLSINLIQQATKTFKKSCLSPKGGPCMYLNFFRPRCFTSLSRKDVSANQGNHK